MDRSFVIVHRTLHVTERCEADSAIAVVRCRLACERQRIRHITSSERDSGEQLHTATRNYGNYEFGMLPRLVIMTKLQSDLRDLERDVVRTRRQAQRGLRGVERFRQSTECHERFRFDVPGVRHSWIFTKQ